MRCFLHRHEYFHLKMFPRPNDFFVTVFLEDQCIQLVDADYIYLCNPTFGVVGLGDDTTHSLVESKEWEMLCRASFGCNSMS